MTEAVDTARGWARDFGERCDEVTAVFLVGSRTTGTATAESDWDFVVIAEPVHGLSAFDGLTYGWLTREDAAALGIAPAGTKVDAYVMRTDESDEDDIALFTERAVPIWMRT